MNLDDRLFRRVLDHLHDGVYFVDKDRHITYWNKGAERITGYEHGFVLGNCCANNILMHVDECGKQLCVGGCPLSRAMEEGKANESLVYFHHADGHRVPVSVRVSPIRNDDGQVIGAAEVFNEVSASFDTVRRLNELESALMRDDLTDIGNRRYLERKLHEAVEEFKRLGLVSGVLFIDIDHFKNVNDTLGHDIGDRALQMVANTLSHNVRAADALGRWGGEEFMVVVIAVDEEQLCQVAEKLRALVAKSGLPLEKGRLKLTVSIGGTLTRAGDTAHSLLKRADTLLYRSKADGRNRVTIEA